MPGRQRGDCGSDSERDEGNFGGFPGIADLISTKFIDFPEIPEIYG
jgi:hypothetical protein